MVLVNGSEEIVPLSQMESMAAALDEVGVDAHATIAQGGHGAGYGGGTKILDQVFPFIGAWLTGEDPPPSPAPSATEPSGGGSSSGETVPAGGKDTLAQGATSAQGEAGSKQHGIRAGTQIAATKSASTGVGMVAVAMIAVVVVFLQFVVIRRLRRRTNPQPRGHEVPTGAGAEGT
jgi:hypothetical protein